jgi:hypothetical protein
LRQGLEVLLCAVNGLGSPATVNLPHIPQRNFMPAHACPSNTSVGWHFSDGV